MFFKLATVLSLALAVNAVQFIIKNNEQGPVWIGIQGNDGRQALENGGFILGQGEQVRNMNGTFRTLLVEKAVLSSIDLSNDARLFMHLRY